MKDLLTNKNHAIKTRRVKPGHYQVIIEHLQSGKCLKVLVDAVKADDMTATDYENYVAGIYQGFVNPTSFEKLFLVS